MNAQPPPQQQIMSSPTTHQINHSPHYVVPTENGTTSEDSDGKLNQCNENATKLMIMTNGNKF